MVKASYLMAGAILLCAVSLTLGTVNDNDIHRMNKSVVNNFFAPMPGKMFEVAKGTATPLCTFANAREAIDQDKPQHRRYTNNLGRNVPVARIVGALLPELTVTPQVELTWASYAEGLKLNFRADLDEDCERMAQAAYRRNSVVCVVDNVFRKPGSHDIVAVRFKHFAFVPSDGDGFPVCPLKTPEDMLWRIRRQFISVAVMSVEPVQADLQG